jgi:phosphatidylserine/phosphatidylglycerophosphate/cardiolipin synthase-like enzyme
MAEFLTTKGISHEIEKIIKNAKGKLFLVSPYLQLSKTLLERLQDASNRGVKIKIIYGKDELKQTEKSSLSALKNLELYFHENLHAKCYFNESRLIITSMNMYQYSEANNREMGVLFDSVNETALFQEAVDEVASILKHSKPDFLKGFSKSMNNNVYSSPTNNGYSKNKSFDYTPGRPFRQSSHIGFCLRCNEKISFNPDRPYCYNCYDVWAEYENPNYTENHCHACGDNFPSSMVGPLCIDCDNKF